ncbi:MAG: transporter [Beijerinckiaceae bacterium]|nr:MAG: transporter [Beijerinckiaceae bacterium]
MNGKFNVPWPSGRFNLLFSIFCRSVFLLAAVAAICALSTVAEAQSAVATPSNTQTQSSAADNPCDGLLATLDRPTIADSPCVVKPGHFLAELGYQYGNVKGSDIKSLSTFTQAELRYGLPEGWELKLFPPNYLISSLRASAGGGQISGLGDTSFGVKHEFGTFGGFTLAADAKVTVPTGNRAFSDGGVEGNIQGIVSYNITPQFSVSGLLGVSTLTNQGSNGVVTRFTSVNPDIVATYQINDRLQLYSEVFGNTATAPNQGSNFTFDGGVQLLLTKSIELDVEAGILLYGPQGLQSCYLGFGTGLSF